MVFFFILLLMFSTSASAYSESLDAIFADFQLYINGEAKATTNKPLIVDDYSYLPIRDISNLFGYIVTWDAEKEQIHIEKPKINYETYTPYEDNGLYGYKNESGDIVIEPTYIYAEEFKEGLALVQFQDLNYGFVNMQGTCIYKSDYMPRSNFNDGIALARENDYTMTPFSKDDKVIVSDLEVKYYFIDKAGNCISESYVYAEPFSEGVAVVQIEGTSIPDPRNVGKIYSYINMDGTSVTDLKFDEASSFENGYANVVFNGVECKIDKNFNFIPR